MLTRRSSAYVYGEYVKFLKPKIHRISALKKRLNSTKMSK